MAPGCQSGGFSCFLEYGGLTYLRRGWWFKAGSWRSSFMRFFDRFVSRFAILILAAACVAVFDVTSGRLALAGQDGKPASNPAEAPIHSLDVTLIDKTCKPCA